MSVCRSELQILGQQYSIDDYRLKRTIINYNLKVKLMQRLSADYGIILHNLLMQRLQFSSRINALNLKRMIVGIQNEQAQHNKTTNMIRQETEYQINLIKNKALIERQTAELIGNNTILRMDQIYFETKLELANLEGLTMNLKGLDFFNMHDRQKKILSFDWVSSLVNNDKLVILNNEIIANSAALLPRSGLEFIYA
jgi:CYTH domain-containing protein